MTQKVDKSKHMSEPTLRLVSCHSKSALGYYFKNMRKCMTPMKADDLKVCHPLNYKILEWISKLKIYIDCSKVSYDYLEPH